MKIKLLFATILFIIICFKGLSQGTDCATSDPFCTGTSYTFPASTNVPDLGTVGCLGTTPNPAWYFLQIANSGPIDIYMSSTPNVDIDFICWGPFSSISAACASNLMSNSGVDCSYSTNWNETCNIPYGNTGEIYVLLITNYSNSPCDINFSQTGGTGTTDCSIMCPNLNNNGPLCPGQTLNLTADPVTGGTYAWTGPGGFTSTQQNPTITNVTTTNGGNYICTVTVGGVASQPCTTLVVVNPNPVITATASPAAICNSNCTNLTASGASTYAWMPGGLSGTTVNVCPTINTTYSVTGTAATGCTGSTTVTVTVNANPTPNVTTTTASCSANNGTATCNPAGSSYNWSNAGTTQTISNLVGGTYTVTLTDLNGCTGTASGVVGNSGGLSLTASSTNENCGNSNGTATATPVGGTAPISYSWSNSGNTQLITGLPAGVYSVTATDANGCSSIASTTITNIAGPSAPLSNIINESCSQHNGSVTVAPINGTTPYTYSWSNGCGITVNSNLVAGVYSVTVTDANNCQAINTVTITDSPPPILSVGTITDATCGFLDGSATINIAGGQTPYTFQWNNGQVTQNLIGVAGGTYSMTVTDANSCKDTVSLTVNVIGGPSASVTTITASCGQLNGSATVTATGGSGTYTYSWSNGQSTSTITNLAAGNYSVTVDDGVCTFTSSGIVGNVPGPVADFSVNPPTITLGEGVFVITDNSTGASTWNWDFGDGHSATGSNPQPFYYSGAGSYTITLIVTDINGCTDSIQHSVFVQDIFTFYVPNSFTPNGDGKNDVFMPTGYNIDMNTFNMHIFDRWGQEVFSTTDMSKPWNGTIYNTKSYEKVVMGVYVYKISLKDLNGIKHEYYGRITVIP